MPESEWPKQTNKIESMHHVGMSETSATCTTMSMYFIAAALAAKQERLPMQDRTVWKNTV